MKALKRGVTRSNFHFSKTPQAVCGHRVAGPIVWEDTQGLNQGRCCGRGQGEEGICPRDMEVRKRRG